MQKNTFQKNSETRPLLACSYGIKMPKRWEFAMLKALDSKAIRSRLINYHYLTTKTKKMNISNTIHACCMDILPMLQSKSFDLAHVDPPYFSGPERRGYYGLKHSKTGIKRVDYAKTETWEIPNESYFDQLFRVSRYQIIWGANYFTFQRPNFKKVEPFKTPRRHDLEAFIADNPKQVGLSGISATAILPLTTLSLLGLLGKFLHMCTDSCGTVQCKALAN